jgi:hypothetical protein
VATGLSALLFGTWAYAATHDVGVRYPSWSLCLRQGSLNVWLYRQKTSQSLGPPNWFSDPMPFQADIFPWTFGNLLDPTGRLDAGIYLPPWIPFVIIAAPTAVLWYVDRRRIPPGHCRKCGYNLTGNVSGRCPECGTPSQTAPQPHR